MKTAIQRTLHSKSPFILDTTCGSQMQTVWLIESASGDSIARVNRESDAMLFLAAPELLEACKACADRLGEMDCGPELEMARAAIAKAEGNA